MFGADHRRDDGPVDDRLDEIAVETRALDELGDAPLSELDRR